MVSGKRLLCPLHSECLFVGGSWGCSGSPRLVRGFVSRTLQCWGWRRGQGAASSTHSLCTPGAEHWFPASIASPDSVLLFLLSHEAWTAAQILGCPYQHFLLQCKCSFILKRSSRNGITGFHIYCILVTSQKIVLACTPRVAFLFAN